MEYIWDNHITNLYNNMPSVYYTQLVHKRTVKPLLGFIPEEVEVGGKTYWLDKFDLDFIKSQGVTPKEVKYLWYVPGSVSAVQGKNGPQTDSYEINILY